MEKMLIHFINLILGQVIDTLRITVERLSEFLGKVVKLMESTWLVNKTRV